MPIFIPGLSIGSAALQGPLYFGGIWPTGRISATFTVPVSELASLPKTLYSHGGGAASVVVNASRKLVVTIGANVWTCPVSVHGATGETLEIYVEAGGGVTASKARARVVGSYQTALDLAGVISSPPVQPVVVADSAPVYGTNVSVVLYTAPSWATSWMPSDQGSTLWGDYRSDFGITTSTGVSSWLDSSGSTRTYAQATGTKQPSIASSANFRGNLALGFDGSDDFLSCPSNITGAALSFAAVVRLRATASYPMLWTNMSVSKELRWDPSGKVQLWTSVTTPTWASASVNTTVIVTGGHDGTTSFVNVNNGTRVTANATIPSATAGSSFIGARDGTGVLYFPNMQLCRLVLFSTLMNSTLEANAYNYLSAAYL